MAIDRRAFLRGASACAVAAGLPGLAAPANYCILLMAEERAPLFEGFIGIYNGIIIRHVDMLGEA